MTEPLTGRVALVTGADGAIGEAVVRRLKDHGATVVGTVRRLSDAASSSDGHDVIEMDVADAGAIVGAVAGVIDRHGGLDILVNAAGAMPFKPLADLEPGDWLDALNVDLVGPFVLIREMLRRGRPGVVVNVASVHALAVEPSAATYAAAKAALLSLTRSAAVEGQGSGLRANAILPGAIDTPMLWSNPNVASGDEAIVPAELGQPADVAGLVAFLASDDARLVNGAAITVDGAKMARL